MLAAIAQPFSGTFKGRVERKRGMTGILLPGMKARADRKDGSATDFGEVREVFSCGQNAAMGHLNDKKSDSENFTPEGWLRTGDTFVANEQGRFL
jgi:long-subunit acyl-CoA synthetase (AMP-forming)